jgi:hypothetical protein
MNAKDRRKVINSFVKDQKGYEHRPMDWQDKLVLLACVVVAILTVMLGGL